MRITCCHCGERGHEEFSYLGDASLRRPTAPMDELGNAMSPEQSAEWLDYVYLRDNPSGPHRELWQHVGGCRAWLVVTRNTRTHEILSVEPATDAARTRGAAI